MTVEELNRMFQRDYGISKPWPKTYEVDAETYGNCCNAIIINNSRFKEASIGCWSVSLTIGKNNGILFKNVELILKVK